VYREDLDHGGDVDRERGSARAPNVDDALRTAAREHLGVCSPAASPHRLGDLAACEFCWATEASCPTVCGHDDDGELRDDAERLKAMGDLARRAVELAHAFIKTGAPSPRAAVSAMFLARAAQAMESTIMLSEAGYIGDAMSVARTVVELDIEHAYIFAADFEQRWERYVAFESTSLDKIMRAVDVLHGGTADKAALAKLRQDAVAAKQLSGSSRNWAGLAANGGEIDLRVRAQTTKRANQYDLSYRDMCGASHGGFSTLRYVLPDQTATVPIRALAALYGGSTRGGIRSQRLM
jgi:hypothetical protein